MPLSESIVRFVDRLYVRPVAALLPRQMFRYALCGGANLAFGWVCYFTVYNFLLHKRPVDLHLIVVSPHIATMLLIFPATFLSGFWLNRQVAFRRSPLPAGIQLTRYLLSVAGSVIVNYACLKFFVDLCGVWPTPAQMLSSFVTLVYSFLAAKYFTFRLAEE